MKNPLLVPELREMLQHEKYDDLEYFCSTNTPSVAADFISALETPEVFQVITHIDPEDASDIFVNLDAELRIQLIDALSDQQLAQLAYYMSDEDEENFYQGFSPEKIKIFESFFPVIEVEEKKAREAEEEEEIRLPEPKENYILDEEGEPFENIDVYKTRDKGLEKIGRFERESWINLEDPEKEELDYIAKAFNIPHDFLTASIDPDERARIEVDEHAILIIIKVPIFDEENKDLLYSTDSMGIILIPNFIITISLAGNDVIPEFLAGKVRNFNTNFKERFVLQLFMRTILLYHQYLKQINNITNLIQSKLQESMQNKQLFKLLNLEKSLVYFTTSLKSMEIMLDRFNRQNILKLDAKNKEYDNIIEDIIIECKQAQEMSNIYSNILTGLMDAFASVISNNLNVVMKLLTLITIILTFPMIVTSFYGMNVGLPLQKSPYVLIAIFSASSIPALATFFYFKMKKWL